MVDTAARDDVVDLLETQHNQIKDLFAQLLSAPQAGGNGSSREEIFHGLVRMLAVHETAEEELVHPVARQKISSGDSIVDGRLTEEHQAKEELSRIYDMGVDSPEFTASITQLRDAVVAHATHEEQEEFNQFRQVIDADESSRLASAVRAAEATAPTRPHAGAESATANMVAGPPLAVYDRIRDAMRDAGRNR